MAPGVAQDIGNVLTVETPEQQEDNTESLALGPRQKWRLFVVLFGLCCSLLLSTLETTIVSTALVTITNELDGFSQRDWIVTSYLLTYTGFLTIFAKFSDIFGRKVLLLFSLTLFIIFSILCGASSSINALIILRAFQGIGGSGIYSLVSVTTIQIVPREKLGKYGAAVSSVFALSSILGPLLGGAITNHARDWPWVFYINGPVGAVAFLIILMFLPSTKSDKETIGVFYKRVSTGAWRRVDVVGAFLLLAASILLVFVLEEAGTRLAWDSAAIIACLVIAGILWIIFPIWEHYVVDGRLSSQEPIFPIRLLKSRMVSAMMLYGFFTGFPFMGVVINLPQRYQAVNAVSPLQAGVYLLPLLLCSPLASAACGYFTSSLKVPPFYLVIAGAVLQVVGVSLMTTLPSTPLELHKQQFGFEVIMGFGFGIGLTTLLVMIPIVVDEEHKPVMVGAITQIRVLGGTIGLAILSQILNNHVFAQLSSIIDPSIIRQIASSASTIDTLSPSQQYAVRTAFADGYTLLMKVLAGLSGLVLVVSCFLWERHPRRL